MCLFFMATVGCVNPGPTIEEYNLATMAYKAADESDAKRYAPKLYNRAGSYLRRGKRAYKERYYDNSTQYFRKSRYYSEKAENISRVKMLMQGGFNQ